MLNETLEIIHLKNPSLYISQVQYMAPTTPRNKLRHPLITAESAQLYFGGFRVLHFLSPPPCFS